MAPDSEAIRAGIEDRLDALFDKIARLSDAELRLLRLAWNEGDARWRREVWENVRSTARRRSREDLLEGTQARLAGWVNNYLSATTINAGTILTGRSGMDPSAVRSDAIAPIMDAAAAIIAADGLEASERELLYGPVARVRPARTGRRRLAR
jgi:hypothetical protein